ncbi:SseB family protein [Natronosporangium hydrolyticum]|uniref:SseB family protein n=1 Tax=Natronosporangium hydrolyticum TaxID=2811111 RepID=A0A895YG59_9ACTN|nr:SseB family protein [Natronosporangium hydrolyticum]QSB16807.1 SseB family protein [Natronosporangium hydrolyticum]
MSRLWLPKNEAERAMADALEQADDAAYFRAFLAAELYLPQVPDDTATQTEGAEQWLPLTTAVNGQIALPIFTSLAAMGSQVIVGKYEVTTFAELCDRWAQPDWLLEINPGSPIEALATVGLVAAAARREATLIDSGDATQEPDTRQEPESASDHRRALYDPGYERGTQAFETALLDTTVVVPTTRDVDFPDESLQPGFPWRVVEGLTGEPTIEVFTHEAGFRDAHPGTPYARMPFLMLMLGWPDGHGLTVNPDGPVAARWSAHLVPELQRRAVAD